MVVSLLSMNKNLKKKKAPCFVSSPSLSVLSFCSEKEEKAQSHIFWILLKNMEHFGNTRDMLLKTTSCLVCSCPADPCAMPPLLVTSAEAVATAWEFTWGHGDLTRSGHHHVPLPKRPCGPPDSQTSPKHLAPAIPHAAARSLPPCKSALISSQTHHLITPLLPSSPHACHSSLS